MKNFTKFYDKILNDENSNFVTVAISWLHIIKPKVPGYLENTSLEKKSNIFYRNIFKFFKRIIIYLFYLLQGLFYRNNIHKIIEKKDLIIISHCLNKKSIENKDFYFEELESLLKKRKINYYILLINHTNLNSQIINKSIKIKNKLVLEKYLNPYEEFKIFILQLKEFLRLINLYFYSKSKFEKNCLKNICLSIFDSQTKLSLRMHILIKKYLEAINPSTMIFTHEGFAWERLCTNAAKEFDSNINVIGYQHSLVSNKNLALLKSINGLYNPDIIWASGKKSFKILKSSKELKKVKIILTGYLKKIRTYKKNFKIKPNCLVVPGATFSENIKLFDFSLKCANKSKFVNFTWRVHPLIDFFKVLRRLSLNVKKLPKNIKISKNNFSHDIVQNSFVVYNDSAAVIEAASGGNIPIYLNLKNQPNIDPIYDYKKSRIYINSIGNFLNLFNFPLNNKKFKKTQNSAKLIIKDIYGKINKNALIKSLKKNDYKKIN